MLRKAKGVARLNLDDFILHASVLGGLFLIIHVVTVLAVKFSGEGTSLMLSGVLLPVAGAFLLGIMSIGHVMTTFEQGVRFGQSRKNALLLTAGQITLECAFVAALSFALTALERAFAPNLWLWVSGADFITWGIEGRMIPEGSVFVPDSAELFIEVFEIDWWAMLLILLAGAVIGFVAGAVMQRFGRTGGWALWGAWMVAMILFPRLPWRTHEVVDWLIPLLVAVAAAAFLWSIWSMLRASIKA